MAAAPRVARADDPLASSRLLRAMRCEAVDATPVWLMRQAGRYLPEYRELRERRSMLELIGTPELAARITLQPLARFPLDAAVVFSDILPPLAAMGLDISFGRGDGDGPAVANPIQRARDIDLLAVPLAAEALPSTLEAIRLVRAELEPHGIPVVGFAGAPFTLASYAIEGGGSRTYAKTKALMYREPAAWRRLMGKLVSFQSDYLVAQSRAGASAVQLFDSWAGLALGREDYERYVAPYNRTVFENLARAGVPSINFSTGTGTYIEAVAGCGGDVVSVDWRLPLGEYRRRIGLDRAIQGNLDPAALLAPRRELEPRIDAVIEGALGSPGHIFNLGHGILPETPIDAVARLVDYVHARSALLSVAPAAAPGERS